MKMTTQSYLATNSIKVLLLLVHFFLSSVNVHGDQRLSRGLLRRPGSSYWSSKLMFVAGNYPANTAASRAGLGGGGTPMYRLYRYVPWNREWFLRF